LTVGLHLPRLARQSGTDGDSTRFLQRLGSLARLALSAGVQKREFLRRQERTRPERSPETPAITSGFLLDRARLVVTPIGLDHVVETFTGRGLMAGGASLDFGRQVVQRLRDVLRQDGRASHLETCLDGPFDFRLDSDCGLRIADCGFTEQATIGAEQVAGLTAWDATAPVKNQLRAAGALHAVSEHGTLALFLPKERPGTAEQVADWLRAAWQQTEVVRLRLVHANPAHRQLTIEG
jgi:hypothetical protein